MQTRLNHLRVCMLVLIGALLLVAFANLLLFAGDVPVGAAPPEQSFTPHRVLIQPVLFRVDPTLSRQVWNAASVPSPVHFACQSNVNPQPSLCYGPYQMRRAYHVDDLINQHITGRGSSITIIDAYGSPTIRQDLQRFNTTWGLPDAPLHIIAPYGVQGSDSAWISETSLDVEWAHVMAPDATINLVLAKDSNDVSIYKVLAYAVKHNLGDIISLSFGENEKCVDPKLRLAEHRVFKEATRKGMTLLAATGDFGSVQLACDSSSFEKSVSFPSDDPLVTAVGGTALVADAITGRYIRETAWNESSAFNKATGGGYSKIYAQPNFQRGIVGEKPGRAVPDISLNASVNGGVIVFESHSKKSKSTIDIMGGTSAAAPELAGILADGVQMAHHRLGAINAALYRLGTSNIYSTIMHDILSGNNILLSSGLPGYRAGAGWDAATGWGSPKRADFFLRALIVALTPKMPVIPPPAQPTLPVSPITGTPGLPVGQPSATPVVGTPVVSAKRSPITPIMGTPGLPVRQPSATPVVGTPVVSAKRSPITPIMGTPGLPVRQPSVTPTMGTPALPAKRSSATPSAGT